MPKHRWPGETACSWHCALSTDAVHRLQSQRALGPCAAMEDESLNQPIAVQGKEHVDAPFTCPLSRPFRVRRDQQPAANEHILVFSCSACALCMNKLARPALRTAGLPLRRVTQVATRSRTSLQHTACMRGRAPLIVYVHHLYTMFRLSCNMDIGSRIVHPRGERKNGLIN